MKTLLKCLVLSGVLALAACGKDNGGSAAAAPATAVVTPNGCTADQIPTQSGCGVYAAQCGPNAGLVGTVCQPAIAPTNCGTIVAGQPAPYGCGGYNGAYNGGIYNGSAYNGGAYNQGGYYASGYNNSTVIYNTQTQTFVPTSTYYSQPVYNEYGYGYRPYPRRSGYISGQVTIGF